VPDAEKYGAAFNVSPAWLLTGLGPEVINSASRHIFYVAKAADSINNDAVNVRLKGVVCAGLWKDTALIRGFDTSLEDRIAPIDPRYPNDAQFDMRVQGSGINKVAHEGSFVRCLDLRLFNHEIKDGDYVVVERQNEDGLLETSAKLLRKNGSQTELHNATDEPHLISQVIIIDDGNKNSKIEIIGKILWAYNKLDE
jgi:hypothetical protein